MRILVVEDEHRIADALKKGLEQERFAVDVAYTGSEGYERASTEEYSLIILDLMLPEMDGMTICRELRAQKCTTPILMLTAKGEIEDTVGGLNAGADDYLTKPFSFDELLARVRALTRRPSPLLPTTLTVADLSLDTVAFTVTRNNQPISLSQKEFSLLEYLMRHPGHILSKQHLITHVWDYDADILPNTVEVYIRNLRTKIDLPFTNLPPLLHTIRGFGYRLGAPTAAH